MSPAFDSLRQAAAFGLLVLFFLAAPGLAGKKILPPREQAYATEGWTWGPYPWIQKQIFVETNDIDIAFVGASHMMWGIDTLYVQEKLAERLGGKAVVRSICWGGTDADALYIITKDLLEHRHVKMLVFTADFSESSPNIRSPHWFRFGDDAGALTGLPFREQAMYYFGSITAMPRNLLELWTPDLPEDTNAPFPNFNVTKVHCDNPESRLGSINARVSIDPVLGPFGKFTPYTAHTGATSADACLQVSRGGTNFIFLNHPLLAWQSQFMREFGLLTKKYGTQLVLLHLPIVAEGKSSVITEPVYWPDCLQTEVTMLGIPPARLFAGLSENEIDRLFAQAVHLNENGQKYFTTLITPALLQLYESRTRP